MSSKQRGMKPKRRSVLTRLEGDVFCDKHGCIHDDSLDPYEMGVDERCDPKDHHRVYSYERRELPPKAREGTR
jgi:hypothetical protein